MDREILFRGKRIDNDSGEWVKGSLVTGLFFHNRQNRCIIMCIDRLDHDMYEDIEVDPETVCQYTGLIDKNGRKIFEGDIVNCHEKRGAAFWHCKVLWNQVKARFDVIAMDCAFPMCLDDVDDISVNGLDYEVIGNIFDNPELVAKPKCSGCKCCNCFNKSECCPECEGPILNCEEYSETDIYNTDRMEKVK